MDLVALRDENIRLREALEELRERHEARKRNFDAVLSALEEVQAENEKLREALEPFANYACEPPCGCHNCKARSALAPEGGEG